MVNGLLPREWRPEFGKAPTASADISNFMQIWRLFASNMDKNQAGLGTGLSSLPVRFNSNTLEKSGYEPKGRPCFFLFA
jgi:hypothetical protein